MRSATALTIIGASQYGIGMVGARIAEIVFRDEHAVVPIRAYNSRYELTLSLPSIIGRRGCVQILEPPLSDDEQIDLKKSIEALRRAKTTFAELSMRVPTRLYVLIP